MDKNDDNKNTSRICILDTSEDESDTENPWHTWAKRLQVQRERLKHCEPSTSNAVDYALPGPSRQHSSQGEIQLPPITAKFSKLFAESALELMQRTHKESKAPSPRAPPQDFVAALNKVIGETNRTDKLQRRVDKHMRKTKSDTSRPTSASWSDILVPSASNDGREKNKRLIKRTLSSEKLVRASGSGIKHPHLATDHGPIPAKIRKTTDNESSKRDRATHTETAANSGTSDNLNVLLEAIDLPDTSAPEASLPVQTAVDMLSDAEGVNKETKATKGAQTVETVDLKLNQALLTLLECPVCLEWMEPPMVQCRRGHLVCRTCRGRLPRCPVCRSSFTSVRNRAMEQVAEKLHYPCRYQCGEVALLRMRTRHEASCLWRSYNCPLPSCADAAPLTYDALVKHHQEKHVEVVVYSNKNTFQVHACANQQPKDWIVFAYSQLFHVHFCADSRNWGLNGSVTYIGPKKNARKYTYEISVSGNQHCRKLVYSRETHSDLEVKANGFARGDAFFIPIDHALNFNRPDRHTLLSLQVSIQPKEAAAPGDSGETS